jgi:hypothetical protein
MRCVLTVLIAVAQEGVGPTPLCGASWAKQTCYINSPDSVNVRLRLIKTALTSIFMLLSITRYVSGAPLKVLQSEHVF